MNEIYAIHEPTRKTHIRHVNKQKRLIIDFRELFP